MRFYCHPIVRSLLVIIQWCRSHWLAYSREPFEQIKLLELNCSHHSTMETNSNQKKKHKEIETMIIDFDCHLMVEINFRFPTNNNKLMLQGIVTKKSFTYIPFITKIEVYFEIQLQ